MMATAQGTSSTAHAAIAALLGACILTTSSACKQETTSAPIAATSTPEPIATKPASSATAAVAPTATSTAIATSMASAPPSPTATSSAASATSSATAPTTTGSGGVVVNPPADAARDAQITAKFGNACKLERTCGALWGIDCEAASDGPYWYVKANTLEKVSGCGGMCMGGRCTNCPPKEWKCPTY